MPCGADENLRLHNRQTKKMCAAREQVQQHSCPGGQRCEGTCSSRLSSQAFLSTPCSNNNNNNNKDLLQPQSERFTSEICNSPESVWYGERDRCRS